ncbi:MAG: ATP-binding protein [Acidobacteriota bacterium]
MRRYLEAQIREDLQEKLVLVSGPRQVGKTTLSKQLVEPFVYLSYDSAADRRMIHREEWDTKVGLVIFDELHKMKKWKSWIKGVYDTRGVPPGLLVTGSARLDVYRKGGDSLAGRYYAYRLHPLTVKECVELLGESAREALAGLLRFGGFPEPYLKRSDVAAARWRRTHLDTIIREDVLDLESVRDLKSIEILIDLLRNRVGAPTSYSSLAQDLQVSVHTVKHWLQILENLCVIFPVRPYHRNIARSILKEPKYYLYDTGAVEGDVGARLENAVANALLRELHLVEDTRGSRTSLHYLRDKEKNEVDFLAIVDGKPVLMVEVKSGHDLFARSLLRFHSFLPTARAIQVVHDLDRRRSAGGVEMLSAHEFLAELAF